jgi:AcrR family transcriptional regulator
MEQSTAPTTETIQDAYIEYVLTHGKQPVSVFAFAKSLGLPESSFYEAYTNFSGVEQAIWASFYTQTIAALNAQPPYQGYSVREKLLAFYFTWIETLGAHRSFVLMAAEQNKRTPLVAPKAFDTLKKHFISYADGLVNQGLDAGELVSRPLLADRYSDGLWTQLLFVTQFWVNDTSLGFEQTDAAIEKAVRLGFELMGQNVLDAATDLAKFLWQNRR